MRGPTRVDPLRLVGCESSDKVFSSHKDIREGCLAEGFDEHLTKPGDIHKLAQLLGGDRLDTDDVSGLQPGPLRGF